MGSTETTSQEEELEGNIYDLSFSSHKSRRYHEKMLAFYGSWRDAMKIVTVISGSGAFFLIFADADKAAAAVSAFIALWSALDVVISPDKKAEKHAQLLKEFTVLAARVEQMPHTLEAYKELVAQRLKIEESEPPCKRLVDLQARNDECRARGFPPEELAPLSKPQRMLGYFKTFGMERIEEWKANRQRQLAARQLSGTSA